MSLPLNTVIQGNCLEVLKTFPGQSVDFVMTSPPYYGLRDYGKELASLVWDGKPDCQHQWGPHKQPLHKGQVPRPTRPNRPSSSEGGNVSTGQFCALCDAWKGQLGLEPTWQMYVHHMTLICTEIKRVLKRAGSFYLVLGDTFAGSHCGSQHGGGDKKRAKVMGSMTGPSPQAKTTDYKPKCLMGIPWRVAFGLIDSGWILRNAITWHKPNAMPSSVKDRLAQTCEYIFHLVKSNRYYYNLDTVREQHKTSSLKRAGPSGVVPFNLRVRDVKGGKMGVTAFGYVTASEQEVQGYNSKYAKQEHGQTLQGLARGQTQFQERRDSHTVAKELFPNDPQKQQKYINYVHDHGTNPLGKNPGDIVTIQPEGHGHDRWATHRGEGLRPWNERFHPKGKNPGDVVTDRVKANLEHFGPKGSGGHYAYGGLDSKNGKHHAEGGKNPGDVLYSLDGRRLGTNVGEKGKLVDQEDQWRPPTRLLRLDGKNPGDFWSITTKAFKGHHYAVYPERICVRPILAACPPDGIGVDPMAGSGTTLVVLKKLGRKWIGIEVNPDYIPIIKNRLSTVPEKLDRFFK